MYSLAPLPPQEVFVVSLVFVVHVQIAGEPAVFGAAREHAKAAVFVLTAGSYFCMVAESNGEAALFDAPEGKIINNVVLGHHHLYLVVQKSWQT